MKIMNVSFTVDVTNEEHVKALEVFTRTLGGLPLVSTIEAPVAKEPAAPAPKKAAAAPAPKKAVVAAAVETETEEEDEEFDLSGGEEEAKVEITTATLRELTAAKQETHRKELVEKLKELGATSVAMIPTDKYQEYYDFITGLK